MKSKKRENWLKRSNEWFEEAQRDLKEAEDRFKSGVYTEACFHSHQAAEKLIKAFFYSKGEVATGHDLEKLLGGLKSYLKVDDLMDAAKKLNPHYFATRYPHARRKYGLTISDYIRELASACLDKVKAIWARLGKMLRHGMKGPKVLKDVQDYVERLRKNIKVHSLVVFGSLAKGDFKPWSDVDMVIIAGDLPRGLDRFELFYLPRDFAMDPRPYTKEEFLKAIEEIDLTAWDSIHEGKVVFDDGFWKSAREKFEGVKKEYGLVKTKTGWKALNPF